MQSGRGSQLEVYQEIVKPTHLRMFIPWTQGGSNQESLYSLLNPNLKKERNKVLL